MRWIRRSRVQHLQNTNWLLSHYVITFIMSVVKLALDV